MKTTINTDYFRMTDEEFFFFCESNRHLHIERETNGTITIMDEPSGFDTSQINMEVSRQLGNWNHEHKEGAATDSNGGYFLPDGSMKAPDAAWVSYERLKQVTAEELKRFPHLSPEFVIEIKFPSDSLISLQNKMEAYMQNDVKLGWLIDPDNEIISIYRANGLRDFHEGFTGKLSGEDVLKGFELDLDELKNR